MRLSRSHRSPWRDQLFKVISGSTSRSSRVFEATLIILIMLSVGMVALESVPSIRRSYGSTFRVLEWCFTILFTTELLARIVAAPRIWRYLGSFYGVVDVISVLPTYLSELLPGAKYVLTLRVIRLLRVFRVLKLTAYVREAQMVAAALRASRRKVAVFMLSMVLMVVILGTGMYVVEGESSGFTDIPTSVYWAVVTLTTVGYGDLSPKTPLGRFLSSLVMLIGYSIIAVPTGIFSVELSRASRHPAADPCPNCEARAHQEDARFCRRCGAKLPSRGPDRP